MVYESSYSPYLIIGKLSRDFILTQEGNDINDIPGGHLLYTAIGMSPWEKHPGLISKVGNNFPSVFIEKLSKINTSLDGIKQLDSPMEHRIFISYFEQDPSNPQGFSRPKNALSQYFRAGKPFPKELLGYNQKEEKTLRSAQKTKETMLARDISPAYLEARCVHICPMDYISHNLLPQAFSGEVRKTITMHSSGEYMEPYYYESIKTLINGISAFITREKYIRSLFTEKYNIHTLADMMKTLLDFGAENIVVKAVDRSYYFINRFDRQLKHIPNVNPTEKEKIGALSCFCGAHLIGLNETYDYQKAAAYGAARADTLRNEQNPYNNLDIYDSLLNEKIRITENIIEG